MDTFTSNGGFYLTSCPTPLVKSARVYVDTVESLLPALRDAFSLEPSHRQLGVVFGDKGSCYAPGGTVYLCRDMDLSDPQNIYGGLFHETTHGFLEKYVHRPGGSNEFPEPCAIILQVAALDRVDKDWAGRYALGYGCRRDMHGLLSELVRIYREHGLAPIRAVYSTMAASDTPVLRKKTFLSDLNSILAGRGVNRTVVS